MTTLKRWRIQYDGWQKDFELLLKENGRYATWGHYKTEKGARLAIKYYEVQKGKK